MSNSFEYSQSAIALPLFFSLSDYRLCISYACNCSMILNYSSILLSYEFCILERSFWISFLFNDLCGGTVRIYEIFVKTAWLQNCAINIPTSPKAPNTPFKKPPGCAARRGQPNFSQATLVEPEWSLVLFWHRQIY